MIDAKEAMARLEKAYFKECDKIGLVRSRQQRTEDLSSALSHFYIRACKLGDKMQNPQAIAIYAVRDVLFRENRKLDRERWASEAEETGIDQESQDICAIVLDDFPEAAEAVNTYSFKIFLRRLLRAGHDASEVADSFDNLFRFFKKNGKIKKK